MNFIIQLFAKRPVLITIIVCALMYVITGLTSNHFFNGYTFVNFFQKDAALGIVAVGITFVILTGGIDLSVGSIVGWSALVAAYLMHAPAQGQWAFLHNWNPYLAMATVVAIATLVGALIGVMIHYLEIPPFLITLAFLFLYRGVALHLTTGEVKIEDPRVSHLAESVLSIPHIDTIDVPVYLWTLALISIVAIGAWLGRYTGFGRSLYAIGGAENSAVLMGLPVARSKVLVYALSGFCAALGGVAFCIIYNGGSALKSRGMELDAIAVTVIGGTLLSGGVGGITSTLVGLLTYGIIQAAMSRHTFPTGVDRMVIGAILLAFILLQKLLQLKRPNPEATGSLGTLG